MTTAEKTHPFDAQIPDLIRVLEIALRSGYDVKQAYEIAAKDLPAPVGAEAQAIVSEIESGVAILDALDHAYQRTGSRDLDLVFAAFRLQMEVGGNLADRLSLLARILEHRRPPVA